MLKSLPKISEKWKYLKFVNGSPINSECSHYIHELKEMQHKAKDVFEVSLRGFYTAVSEFQLFTFSLAIL